MNKHLLLETVLVSCGGPYSEELALAVCYGTGELPGGCSGNGGMSLGCSAGAGCSADIPVVGLDTVTFTCGLPTYDPPTPDFDQSFYDEWEGDYGHHPGHGVTPDKSIPGKTSITNLTKKIIQEQIGGEIKSPNEFTYFDFKDWVWSDRKYYFREKTFKDNNNMTLAQAVEENLLEDIFQMLTTLWETFIEETEVSMHGKIKDENRLKFGEDLYEMMKEDNLLFKKDKTINSSLNLAWPRSFQLNEQGIQLPIDPNPYGDSGCYNCMFWYQWQDWINSSAETEWWDLNTPPSGYPDNYFDPNGSCSDQPMSNSIVLADSPQDCSAIITQCQDCEGNITQYMCQNVCYPCETYGLIELDEECGCVDPEAINYNSNAVNPNSYARDCEYCTDLEQHANSLGMQSGVPGVNDTIMTAADQFCIKCQAALVDPMCDCCDTDYTYDDNVITYDGETAEIPIKDPVRNRLKKLAGILKKK